MPLGFEMMAWDGCPDIIYELTKSPDLLLTAIKGIYYNEDISFKKPYLFKMRFFPPSNP